MMLVITAQNNQIMTNLVYMYNAAKWHQQSIIVNAQVLEVNLAQAALMLVKNLQKT